MNVPVPEMRNRVIVDPEARALEAFALQSGRWVDAGSFDESAVARVPPFDDVELPIARLFLPRRATQL